MGLKLYGFPASTCTARVKAALEEYGVEYELVPINLATGEHKQPAYISHNPFGQVPALQDGDLTLFESRAITRYIARKYKNGVTDLLKESDVAAVALVDVWMEVETHQFNPAVSTIFYQIFVMPVLGGTPDQARIAENVEKLSKVLDVYEDRLSKSKYLAGDFFSLADLHHLTYTFYLMKTHASLVNCRPHVKAWWEGMSSRPACKKVTDEMAADANASK